MAGVLISLVWAAFSPAPASPVPPRPFIAQKAYEQRNKPAYDQWEHKFIRLRDANTPSVDMSQAEIISSAATGTMARQAMATVAFAQFQMNGPTPSNLSANECAMLRNEMQSGKYDLKRPKSP